MQTRSVLLEQMLAQLESQTPCTLEVTLSILDWCLDKLDSWQDSWHQSSAAPINGNTIKYGTRWEPAIQKKPVHTTRTYRRWTNITQEKPSWREPGSNRYRLKMTICTFFKPLLGTKNPKWMSAQWNLSRLRSQKSTLNVCFHEAGPHYTDKPCWNHCITYIFCLWKRLRFRRRKKMFFGCQLEYLVP